jgi:hypothetical protein
MFLKKRVGAGFRTEKWWKEVVKGGSYKLQGERAGGLKEGRSRLKEEGCPA